MEQSVFLHQPFSAQMLPNRLRARFFPERSQKPNKATQGLENEGGGKLPVNPKLRSLPPSRPPFSSGDQEASGSFGAQVSRLQHVLPPPPPPPSYMASRLSFHLYNSKL